MNKKLKALVGSALAIAMSASIAAGGTFALFTDKAEVNVAITAGKVDVDANISALRLYSMDRYMGDDAVVFENLGTATLTNKTLTLTNITPGDKVEFDIDVTSMSNVKTKMRTSIIDMSADDSLMKGLKIVVDGEELDIVGSAAISSWKTVDPIAGLDEEDKKMTVSIELPVEAGNEYQDKAANLTISLEAVQWNGTPLPVVSSDALKNALEMGLEEIRLDSDISLQDEPIVIKGDVTLDLGGHTITGVATSASASNLITVPAGSTLTLKNGKVSFGATTPDTNWGGVGQPAFPGYANNTINCRGNLIIDGATIENLTQSGGASYAIDCYDGSNLTVNSGVIDGCGKIAIRIFTNNATSAPNVTINGGTVTGYRAVWMQLAGSNNLVAPNTTLTVNGGTLISTDSTYKQVFYSYSYGNSFSGSSIILNGGEYYGDVAFGGGQKIDAHKEISIDYANCKFYGGIYSYNDADNFTEVVATETFAVVDNATDFVANLATVDAVVLTGDIDFADTQVTIPAGKDVVLNLNGHNVEAEQNGTTTYGLFTVPSGSSLTVKGEGDVVVKTNVTNGISACIFQNDGVLNIYGGNYEANQADSVKGLGALISVIDNCPYNTDAVVNIYDGTFAVTGLGAINIIRNWPIQKNTATTTLNIYGGTFKANTEVATTYIWNKNDSNDAADGNKLASKINFYGGIYEDGVVYEDYQGQADIYIADGVDIKAYSENN